MMFDVLIVDDEPLAREAIRLRLLEHHKFKVCGEADNGNDAIVLLDNLKPDVVFLDIEMPEMGGLEAAKVICNDPHIRIVFVTAFSHHALEAFRVNAVDYLLKPINDELFSQVMIKLEQSLGSALHSQHNQNIQSTLQAIGNSAVELVENTQILKYEKPFLQRLALTNRDQSVMLNVKDIESIVSVKDNLCIRVKNDVHVYRKTMKDMQALLNPEQFVRCHRSHIVNCKFIASVQSIEGQLCLVCTNGEQHPISRRHKGEVKAFLNKFGKDKVPTQL